ncbi:hypothetical protein [Glycomyces terrestris]|uniref:Uncharacterized protein n=1 Tax=Glycomyces terrestris TaxID=2493553 RepID=A0A426V3Y3_9ACTN|nr:hypothetical protein [Glycomyces terrestris]RRS01586.1 hypothetical protein EIW28_02120 [Glycomyces terrestris]
MSRPVPGPGALVSYIQTGARDARIAYRALPDRERIAYRDTVNRVYAKAMAHHFGHRPSRELLEEFIDQVADRHPQYAGGVRRVVRAEGGPGGGIHPRQVLTAQHLVIREIAKRHPGFRSRADQVVAAASRTLVPAGAAAGPEEPEFTGSDAQHVVALAIGLDGMLRSLDLLRGAERLGGRSIGKAVIRAWVAAEKQRWARAKELGVHDDFPEIGSGRGGGDAYRCEAYSSSRLCRATLDRYGRVRDLTFMRTDLFGDDGRHGLAAEIREAIRAAQSALTASW